MGSRVSSTIAQCHEETVLQIDKLIIQFFKRHVDDYTRIAPENDINQQSHQSQRVVNKHA